MFFIFDFDEVAEGAEAGILMGIKLLITLFLLSFPLTFLDDGGNVAIAMIGFAILFAGLYLNIVTLVNAIKRIKDKRNSENPYNHYEADYTKLRKRGKFVLWSIIILSVIGLIFPLYLNFINIKLSRLASFIFLPYLFNIIFYIMLQTEVNGRGKTSIGKYFNEIKEYLLNIFLKKVLLIIAVSFFIFSVLWNVTTEFTEFRYTTINTFMHKVGEFLTTQVQYYDEKFEEARSNNFSMVEKIEEQILYIRNVAHEDADTRFKTAAHSQPNSNTEHIAQTYIDNEPSFVLAYFGYDEDFYNTYGLELSIISNFYQTDYENKYWIMDVYDAMYDKTYYYKYDYEQAKIIEIFENKTQAENEITRIKRELKEMKLQS